MRYALGFLLCLLTTNLFANDLVIDQNGIVHGTGLRKAAFKGLSTVYDTTVLKDLPASFDLRAMGDVSPIKDQGQCGSCWAHATTESLEDAILFAGKPGLQLSVQQMTGCNSDEYGCGGGEMGAADYLVNPGLALDKDFPYQGDGSCKSGLTTAAKAASWAYVGDQDNGATSDQIKSALVAHGSVFVTVAASGSDWSGQSVMTDCGDNSVDHMVELVGWNTSGQWIMRNSWGTDWGDKGFAYMPFGCDSVGVGSQAAAYTVY